MSSTALGAEKAVIFISDAHEKIYYEKLKEAREQEVYQKSLVYCLGINDATRRNIYSIYDFKTGCVKTGCLHEGWQTSGNAEEQVGECKIYTVEELFCCAYAHYFWQAVQIRYSEYAMYDHNLHAMFGGLD